MPAPATSVDMVFSWWQRPGPGAGRPWDPRLPRVPPRRQGPRKHTDAASRAQRWPRSSVVTGASTRRRRSCCLQRYAEEMARHARARNSHRVSRAVENAGVNYLALDRVCAATALIPTLSRAPAAWGRSCRPARPSLPLAHRTAASAAFSCSLRAAGWGVRVLGRQCGVFAQYRPLQRDFTPGVRDTTELSRRANSSASRSKGLAARTRRHANLDVQIARSTSPGTT